MSVVRLIIRDLDRSIYSDQHGGFADSVIAALSADPHTIEELDTAIERFIAPSEWSYFRGFGEGLDDEPVDAGLVVIDLAARLVNKSAGRFELRPNPHRFAAFHVLRRADSPAVLFEAGYISNADDESLLRSPEHRAAIALALAQAIETDVATHARR